MSVCNDPKCPLIRKGIQHDAHDKIGDQDVVDPCNDPRCVVNRTGVLHNKHDKYFRRKDQDGKKAGTRDGGQESHRRESRRRQDDSGEGQKSRQNYDDGEDIMDRIFREVLDELDRQSRQRQRRAGRSGKRQSVHGVDLDASKTPQRAQPGHGANQVPAGNVILSATDPHDIFGVPKEATCRMIKSRYRDLARAYDPSKGIINKSDIDKKISNEIMTRINSAYLQLKEIYGCRK